MSDNISISLDFLAFFCLLVVGIKNSRLKKYIGGLGLQSIRAKQTEFEYYKAKSVHLSERVGIDTPERMGFTYFETIPTIYKFLKSQG